MLSLFMLMMINEIQENWQKNIKLSVFFNIKYLCSLWKFYLKYASVTLFGTLALRYTDRASVGSAAFTKSPNSSLHSSCKTSQHNSQMISKRYRNYKQRSGSQKGSELHLKTIAAVSHVFLLQAFRFLWNFVWYGSLKAIMQINEIKKIRVMRPEKHLLSIFIEYQNLWWQFTISCVIS